MSKLLSDTRLVAALVALAIICLTVLAVTKVIPGADAFKVLAGLITGVILAWQRGTVPTTTVDEKTVTTTVETKKETPIPPVLPLLGICLAFLLLPGATCAQAKPIIRNANDIAADWCAAHYSQAKGLSVDDALRTFCTGEKLLKPWLDLILLGQKNGVAKMGESPGETKCEITVTPPAATDAGKD